MTPSTTRIAEATVDLDAIAHNTAVFAGRTDAAVMAVVKADGFGHGALPVARAALASGATWLGVTTCAEAMALRRGGVVAPVLSWLHTHDDDFRGLISNDVDLSVSSLEHLDGIAGCAADVGGVAAVHLKVDTGLHRNGARAQDWADLVRRARDLERAGLLRVRGLWSHLISGSDARAETVGRQVALFDAAVAHARDAGLRPEVRHLANSAAALDAPETHYELVRPGIGLYGAEPDVRHGHGLRGAMTLRARLILAKRVPGGSGVSYEHDYTTSHDTTLGLVPLGYADGVPRSAGTSARVWIGGRLHPIAGRIAMDQFVVDLGGATAQAGDEVVLFGPGDDGEPTVADWATWAGTIPHEVFTGIGTRVPRRHVGERALTGRVEESLIA
jgi:alanine racemase